MLVLWGRQEEIKQALAFKELAVCLGRQNSYKQWFMFFSLDCASFFHTISFRSHSSSAWCYYPHLIDRKNGAGAVKRLIQGHTGGGGGGGAEPQPTSIHGAPILTTCQVGGDTGTSRWTRGPLSSFPQLSHDDLSVLSNSFFFLIFIFLTAVGSQLRYSGSSLWCTDSIVMVCEVQSAWVLDLWHAGSLAVVPRLCCPMACGILVP